MTHASILTNRLVADYKSQIKFELSHRRAYCLAGALIAIEIFKKTMLAKSLPVTIMDELDDISNIIKNIERDVEALGKGIHASDRAAKETCYIESIEKINSYLIRNISKLISTHINNILKKIKHLLQEEQEILHELCKHLKATLTIAQSKKGLIIRHVFAYEDLYAYCNTLGGEYDIFMQNDAPLTGQDLFFGSLVESRGFCSGYVSNEHDHAEQTGRTRTFITLNTSVYKKQLGNSSKSYSSALISGQIDTDLFKKLDAGFYLLKLAMKELPRQVSSSSHAIGIRKMKDSQESCCYQIIDPNFGRFSFNQAESCAQFLNFLLSTQYSDLPKLSLRQSGKSDTKDSKESKESKDKNISKSCSESSELERIKRTDLYRIIQERIQLREKLLLAPNKEAILSHFQKNRIHITDKNYDIWVSSILRGNYQVNTTLKILNNPVESSVFAIGSECSKYFNSLRAFMVSDDVLGYKLSEAEYVSIFFAENSQRLMLTDSKMKTEVVASDRTPEQGI